MKYFYFKLVSLIIAGLYISTAASVGQENIPMIRQSFHDKINTAQLRILRVDGQNDSMYQPSKDNAAVNARATHAVISEVDSIQSLVEADNSMDNNEKIRYLRGLDELLTSFEYGVKLKSIKNGVIITELIPTFRSAVILTHQGKSILPLLAQTHLTTDKLISTNFAFKNDQNSAAIRQAIITKELRANEKNAIVILSHNMDYYRMDSALAKIARRDPDVIYTYARANDSMSYIIRKNPDMLIQTILKAAEKKDGRQYFPFLDMIYRGRLTFEDIEAKSTNDVDYYKLLVATEIDYAHRVLQRDTPMAMKYLYGKLKNRATETFVNVINGLHENPDLNVRFKVLEPLNAQELYYLAVTNEEELYTSSYLFGVYPQIFEKGGKDFTGDQLLMSIYFDNFRKWIKMAANYNKLGDFLKRMTSENADMLMKEFVRNLDKSHGADSLEFAVDVAGSFGSIKESATCKLIQDEVSLNLQRAQASGNRKAENIYKILDVLFRSLDETNKVNVSSELGIPPVYTMPLQELVDPNKNRIIVQQYFYGDKDGQTAYNTFLSKFSNDGWKVTQHEEWTLVSSTKGTPISIYSNRPLDEEKGLDDKAQEDLNQYLADNNLDPTVVIHRGHSYYLPSTIKQLAPSAKVVMLGSCGAFQSLNDVLRIAPEAHIISSRQTGTNNVNTALIYGILNRLREGQSLNWVEMWREFSKKMAKDDQFSDYVPPYENLGAVFIMAYTHMQNIENEQNADND